MKGSLGNKSYVGIVYTILISAAFILLSLLGLKILPHNWIWYMYSSMIRVLFGIFTLWVMRKLFNKKICDIINRKNMKLALIAGIGFELYFIYYLIIFISGFRGFYGLSISLVVFQIFLQQITTGFYEEILYRGLVLEGYFTQEKKNAVMKLLYGFTAFVIFGALHIVTNFDLLVFLKTGTIGFAFAVIYLVSHNVLVPMILHFAYDVFANLAAYMNFENSEILNILNTTGFDIMYVVMFLVSLLVLLKMPQEERIR